MKKVMDVHALSEDTARAQPGACLLMLPEQRPCGLPSHLARLNGAGHTGRRALDVLKWASRPFVP